MVNTTCRALDTHPQYRAPGGSRCHTITGASMPVAWPLRCHLLLFLQARMHGGGSMHLHLYVQGAHQQPMHADVTGEVVPGAACILG